MSYTTQGENGLKAVKEKRWTDAIKLLSTAINTSKAPHWLLGRAHAYQETKQFEKALADAELAYITAAERNQPKSRDQMVTAQYRRGVVLGHMKRYADADACCAWSQQLIEGKNFSRTPDDVATNVDANGSYLMTREAAKSTATIPDDKNAVLADNDEGKKTRSAYWSQAYVWRSIMLGNLEKLPKDDPAWKITVKRVPDRPSETASAKPQPTKTTDSDEEDLRSSEPKKDEAAAVKKSEVKWATKKLRVDFYQSAETVNLILYAKGAEKGKVKVHVFPSEVHLFNLPEAALGSTWAVLDLGGVVDRRQKIVNVTPFKIELILTKKHTGHKWGSWGTQRDAGTGEPPKKIAAAAAGEEEEPAEESAEEPATESAVTEPDTKPAAEPAEPKKSPVAAAAPQPEAGAPAYPTSSKNGPKNWDKFGDDDDDDAAKDSNPDDFFKQLYASATPDVQRAMMKSYIESNGTSLSTDWNQVSSGPVETQPPDGMEAKKW